MPVPLHRHEDLLARLASSHELRQRVHEGAFIRVRRGVYADGESWSEARAEERVACRARALQLTSKRRLVFSHETAAALLGMPLYRPDLARSHVILDSTRPGATSATIRHRGEVRDDELCEVDGLLCTGIVRTVADMARRATFEQAVVVADAALRARCSRSRATYDTDEAWSFAQEVLACARRSAHGLSRSERVMGFADGRAELPGESISRIRLHELGFRSPRLQVAVPGPGTTYYVDFELEEARAFGEFDGRWKYGEDRFLGDRTPAQVLDEEKQREDWIRGTTHRRMARWGWQDLVTAAHLGRRLEAFGIRPAR